MAEDGPRPGPNFVFKREYSHAENKDPSRLNYKAFQRKLLSFEIEDIGWHKEIIDALTAQYRKNWDKGLGAESFVEDTFGRSQMRNCIFVGHVNTDLDSIAGAVGAAELFNGIAARSEERLNGEIECALNWIGMEPPPVFDSLPGAQTQNVCLVDHNEVDQMTPILKNDPKRMKRIVGLIDHHAVASSFSSSTPLFMDTRPWGSMSSIVFHTYLRNRVPIRKEIARLLLCAILSDTLNLKSGTTTPADRFCVALLSSFGEVEDINELAFQLFTAKTNWIVNLGAYEMVRGDQKNFEINGVRLSIAVLEVTTMPPILDVAEDLMIQLRVFKYQKGDYIDEETHEDKHDVNKEVHCALLFVVDTVNQESCALICGAREQWLVQTAFPEGTWERAGADVVSPSEFLRADQTLCRVGKLVSRKLDFVPRATAALQENKLPDWYLQTSKEMKRLAEVMASGQGAFVYTVRMEWDRTLLRSAIFTSKDISDKGDDAPRSQPGSRRGSRTLSKLLGCAPCKGDRAVSEPGEVPARSARSARSGA